MQLLGSWLLFIFRILNCREHNQNAKIIMGENRYCLAGAIDLAKSSLRGITAKT